MSQLDIAEYRSLVLWLENRKIRFYTEEDRKSLSALEDPKWDSAFLKYLDDRKFFFSCSTSVQVFIR
jgi:hypothetical protein